MAAALLKLLQKLGDGYGRLLSDHRELLRVAVDEAGGVEGAAEAVHKVITREGLIE